MAQLGSISADQLRLLVERIERLEEEKRGIAEDIRDVYGEAKATGFDVRTMRTIIRLRRMEKHHRDEADMLLDTYKAALGMDFTSTPLGAAIQNFEQTTEGIAVTMTVAGGDEVALNQEARDSAAESEGYADAVALVREHQKASTSWLQRQLRIGYNPAARLIERMEREGIVSRPDHVGRREVLAVDPRQPSDAPDAT
jgi:uncharacterized protein (UPF0335 family)